MGSTPPLAALTTIFTPPCQTSWLVSTSKIPSQFPPFPTQGPASCDPPEWPVNIADKGFPYYSPAICPSGFEVGPDCEVRTRMAEEKFPAIAAGETAFYCVPSGFTCTSDTSDFRGGIWGYTVTGQTSGKNVDCTVGPAMQIRWKEEDLEALETHPLTPGLVLAGGGKTTLPPATIQPSTIRFSVTPISTTPEVTARPRVTEITDTTETTEVEEPTVLPTITESTTEQTEFPTKFSTVVTTMILSGGLLSVSTVTAGLSELSPSGSGVSTTSPGGGAISGTPTPPGSQTSNTSSSGGKVMGNPIALATVFLSSLFVGVGLVAVAYVLFRRHRSKAAAAANQGHGQEWNSPFSFGAGGVRIQRDGERLRQIAVELEGSAPSASWPAAFQQLWRTRAELGTDGPTPELGTRSAVGTWENPAELECREAAASSSSSSSRRRWSWLSHVSDKLSVRSKKSSPRAPASRGRGAALMPRRTLSEASDASTSTMGSVSSEKALLSRQDLPR